MEQQSLSQTPASQTPASQTPAKSDIVAKMNALDARAAQQRKTTIAIVLCVIAVVGVAADVLFVTRPPVHTGLPVHDVPGFKSKDAYIASHAPPPNSRPLDPAVAQANEEKIRRYHELLHVPRTTSLETYLKYHPNLR